MDESTKIYLNCYHVLSGSGDGHAVEMLRQAYAQLRFIDDKIHNAGIQATFWENVPAHRNLLQLYRLSYSRGNQLGREYFFSRSRDRPC